MKADGDIIGQVVTPERQHKGVSNILIAKYGKIRRTPAKVQKGRALLPLFIGEHRFARCQRLQHDVADIQTGTVGTFDDIVGGGYRPGHDMNLRLKPNPRHAHRILYAVLIIHDVLLGQHMNHLPVHGDGNGTRRIDHPVNIVLCHLRSFDSDDSPAVEAGNVSAGDAGVN